ncbi:glycine/D-amino acid oxidase, deaminating [Caulobacter sp. AP07]|uniref:NAD(P)/FAD-dependent oxidoreductase n=1 Tax=Caulobacter sp. AP07 TaxID=1144304 RepID=UPI000271E8CF|nr:FAD-binding oxidoreductase [Caulobacter sp. AP07]EJL30778.1 glycine/D-amino acid oxidase, deaminating [Caulobacter sp. AP07]
MQPSRPRPDPIRQVRDLVQLAATGGLDVLKGLLSGRDGGAIVPGRSRARSIDSDQTCPAQVDVVVIGGGYVGCLTALTLAERGVSVALCEKGVVAGEASGRSLGVVEGQFLDASKVEIVNRAKTLWGQMNARVGGETGYRRDGMAALFGEEGLMAYAEGWLDSVRDLPGVDAKLLSARQADRLAVGGARPYLGGLFQASDASVEPQLAAPAIAEAVRKAGGIVLQNCAVRGVETSAGAISAVVTELGRIACQGVVVAGGAWSPVLLRSLGLDLPQFMAFSSVVRLGRAKGPATPFMDGHTGLVVRRTIHGEFDVCRAIGSVPVTPDILGNLGRLSPAMRHMGNQLEPVWNLSTFLGQWRLPKTWSLERPSPFEQNRILTPEVRNRLLDDVVGTIAGTFPALGAGPVVDRWAGAMTSTIDNMPVISAVEGRPGLFIGSGFYFGLTMAPAAGEALADLVMGRTPAIDLSLYRYSRFSDGSPLVFRP